jgi:lipopolysaccharide/colanic/teichoic acid biosynthesis glycosyltransferase
MIDFDIRYAQTRSLGLDLKIICRTIPALCEQLMESSTKVAPVTAETPKAEAKA